MMSHHPQTSLLRKFSEGTLSPSLSSVLSAHIEHCDVCKKQVQILEKELAEQHLGAEDLDTSFLNTMWQQMETRLQTRPERILPQGPGATEKYVSIDGVDYLLPHALRNWDAHNMKWMSFGKGGKITRVAEESSQALYLIYLPQNQEVPKHSHEGAEYSYVISGQYSSLGNIFDTGDFSYSDQSVVHAPKALSEDGCLILSCVEQRLNFFQGFLKSFNGLLWWALNQKFKWF